LAELVVDPVTKELVDAETGEVVEDRPIDLGPEWRAFTAEEEAERVRASCITPLLHDWGLGTEVGDRRLSRANRRVRAPRLKSERRLAAALSAVARMAPLLGAPKIVEEHAAVYVRKMVDKRLCRDAELCAAAALLIAMRLNGVPATIGEAALRLGLDRDALLQLYWEAVKALGASPKMTAQMYVPKIVSALGLPDDVAILAARIAEAARRSNAVGGASPALVAAASVYIAANALGHPVTQQRVAKAVGMSEVGLRSLVARILQRVDVVVKL